MASATLSTRAPTRDTKSNVTALRSVLTPALRARIEAKVASLLDNATMLLGVLDDADRATFDMEPDFDGEEDNQDCCAAADDDPVSMPDRQNRNDFAAGTPEDDEASAQPITLSPDRRPVVVYRPTAKEMRAAYRRNGDPIPANLRRFRGLTGSARA